MRPRACVHLLSLPALLIGCGAPSPAAPLEDRGRLVRVESARVDVAEDRISLLGDLHGEIDVRVFAPMPERIRVLHVHEGDRVQAGQPLVTLDADLAATSLDQAAAALAAAEAARDQLQADLARARSLVASGAMPAIQADALAGQIRTAEAQVAQLAAARRGAGEQRARTIIRAPAAGTVALLSAQDGDTVAPTVPICSIVDARRLRLVLRVTELDYVRIRDGMEVSVRPPALPDTERVGRVARISPVLDRLTRTATVEVTLDNEDGLLRPGMIAQADIVLSRREAVTMIPSRAVVMTPETDLDRSAVVFVVEREGDREIARRRDVRLGTRFGEAMEIAAGIEAGEPVIVEGQHLLRDGSRVRTSEPTERGG